MSGGRSPLQGFLTAAVVTVLGFVLGVAITAPSMFFICQWVVGPLAYPPALPSPLQQSQLLFQQPQSQQVQQAQQAQQQAQPQTQVSAPSAPRPSNPNDFDGLSYAMKHPEAVNAYQAPRALPVKYAFTPEECKWIVQTFSAGVLDRGQIQTPYSGEGAANFTLETKTRSSRGIGIAKNQETSDWIYKRIIETAITFNKDYWHYRLPRDMNSELVEHIQFHQYLAEEAGHYDWHQDVGVKGVLATRRLSIVLQLSAPEEYEGGVLELKGNRDAIPMPNDQGAMIIFPSYMLHRVTTVTKGTRYSLALWFQTAYPQ